MKKIVFLQLLLLSGAGLFAQELALNDNALLNDGGRSDEYATIYLYRPKALYGILWNYTIKLEDGHKIKIRNGAYEEIRVKPGEHKFVILDFGKNELELSVEAGKDYYVQTYLRRAIFMAVPEMAEVTPRFGKTQLARLKE